MKILFLGGTGFVGRHMVSAALNCGHDVTIFTRNKTNSDIFPDVERLVGDRDGGLDTLIGRRWDAVVDVNGYVPRVVRDSLELLRGSVGRYLFVSAGNVCFRAESSGEDFIIDENTPRTISGNPQTEEYWGGDYGALKARCEEAVEEVFPDNSLIFRLGVVAGPFDPTDRVTYWVDRVARGGEVFVPAKPDSPINFIDARDLADFTMLALEKSFSGIFNVAGQPLTWMDWLSACRLGSRSEVKFKWSADVQMIAGHVDLNSRPFGALPMMPGTTKIIFSSEKAVAAGLKYREQRETAADILSWHRGRSLSKDESSESLIHRSRKALDWAHVGDVRHWMAGLTSEQEMKLLQELD